MENNKEHIYEKIIAVTNRKICRRPYLDQIERICRKHPHAIILREKDLEETAYEHLLAQVKQICDTYKVNCIAHTYAEAAMRQGVTSIHLPLPLLESQPVLKHSFFKTGVSIHSVEEAETARNLGADYVTAGHIFSTDCKPGVPPRGSGFLRDVCGAVDIPVYAIGGMQGTKACLDQMQSFGAAGICVMSECMKW